MKRIISVCAAVILLNGCLCGGVKDPCGLSTILGSSAAAETVAAGYSEAPTYADRYWIADMSLKTDDDLPGNYRTMEDEFGSHKKMSPPPETEDRDDPPAEDGSEKPELPADDGMEETELPSRQGMDTLWISGSGEFSAESFKTMIEDIRSRTDGVICVFDLRQETHGFVNGTPVSLYAKGNTGNVGLDPDEVLNLEKEQLGELLGTELKLKSHGLKRHGKGSDQETVIDVDEVMTEQELCGSQDVRYVRISCTDHLCPEDQDVDDFMAAYLALPEGAWLHFHCAAGVGRTGLFMMMADMIRNPDVALDDIISRQVLLGANDPRDPKGSEGEDSDEKIDLLQRFYSYVQDEESAGFQDTFTEWNRSK